MAIRCYGTTNPEAKGPCNQACAEAIRCNLRPGGTAFLRPDPLRAKQIQERSEDIIFEMSQSIPENNIRGRQDLTSAERKLMPLHRGCLLYFPDALMLISALSRAANEKHNPGEPMHWSKDKSNDHEDCAARHSLDANEADEFGINHRVARTWRALADLQTAVEELGYDALIDWDQLDG